MSTLSPYARAHLRLLELDKRFEALAARNRHRNSMVHFRYRLARMEGQHQKKMFLSDVKLFDMLVHRRFN